MTGAGAERAGGPQIDRWHRPSGAHLAAVTPGALLLLALVWRGGVAPDGSLQFTLFDDAMVSMTYARTLAETGEWVWFPGAERVQGFTNPLWTLMMALLHLSGLRGSAAALAVSLIGVALLIGCGLLVGVLIRSSGHGSTTRAGSIVAAATVPLMYPLAFWTLRGMEVGLLALLALVMVAACWRVQRDWQTASATPALVWCATAGALGVATRLDFILVAGALLVWPLVWAPTPRHRVRLAVFAAAPIGVTVLAVLGFQRAYWGTWLPNTYDLKMAGFGVLDHLHRGIISLGVALPLLVAASAASLAAATGPVHVRRLSTLLATVVAVTTIYNVWVGGDSWEDYLISNRHLSLGIPAAVGVVVLGAGQRLSQSSAPRPLRAGWAGIALWVAAGLGHGLTTNPFGWFAGPAAVVTVALALLAPVVAWSLAPTARGHGGAFAGVALALIVPCAAVPLLRWASTGEDLIHQDRNYLGYGEQVRAGTQPGARVAVIAAGATAYYAERPAVDLLGKSDRRIAQGPPAKVPLDDPDLLPYATLYPGHNKWNYAYSIGQLRPDVMVGWWGDHAVEEQLVGWGYDKRCLEDGTAILIRSGSALVRRDAWARCQS